MNHDGDDKQVCIAWFSDFIEDRITEVQSGTLMPNAKWQVVIMSECASLSSHGSGVTFGTFDKIDMVFDEYICTSLTLPLEEDEPYLGEDDTSSISTEGTVVVMEDDGDGMESNAAGERQQQEV